MKNKFVYGLFHPISGELKYIGSTINLSGRFASHICDKRDLPRNEWIRGLLKNGLKPEMDVIEEFDSSSENPEFFWISYFISIGCKLTNKRDTPALKSERSFLMKGNLFGVGNRNFLGKKSSDETKLKMSIVRTGKKWKRCNLKKCEIEEIYRLSKLISVSEISKIFKTPKYNVFNIKSGNCHNSITNHRKELS